MKVVADTMIWISVSVDPDGFRSQVIEEAIRQRVRFYVSDYILDEIVNSMVVHLQESKSHAKNSRQAIARRTKLVALPVTIPRYVLADPKDDAIVQTAVSAGADYLVTEDKEILRLKKIRGVQVITAAEFAQVLG